MHEPIETEVGRVLQFHVLEIVVSDCMVDVEPSIFDSYYNGGMIGFAGLRTVLDKHISRFRLIDLCKVPALRVLDEILAA